MEGNVRIQFECYYKGDMSVGIGSSYKYVKIEEINIDEWDELEHYRESVKNMMTDEEIPMVVTMGESELEYMSEELCDPLATVSKTKKKRKEYETQLKDRTTLTPEQYYKKYGNI